MQWPGSRIYQKTAECALSLAAILIKNCGRPPQTDSNIRHNLQGGAPQPGITHTGIVFRTEAEEAALYGA